MHEESPEIHDTHDHFTNREIRDLQIIVSHVIRDGKGRVTEMTIATQMPNKEDWKKIEDAVAAKTELRGVQVTIESLEDKGQIAEEFNRVTWAAMEAVMAEDARNRKIEKKTK